MNISQLLHNLHCLIANLRLPLHKLRHNSFGKDNFIAEHVLLHGCNIGNYNYIGNYSILNFVDLGNYCSIAPHCIIGGEEHAYWDYSTSTRLSDNYIDGQRTSIGHDVWVGANCYIRQGIKIGDGAIIGANSLVLNDVEPYTIVVGSPAKFLKMRFDNKMLNTLKQNNYYHMNQEDARKLISDLHKT